MIKTKIYYKLKNDSLATYCKELISSSSEVAITLWQEELKNRKDLIQKYKYDNFAEFFNEFVEIKLIVSEKERK